MKLLHLIFVLLAIQVAWVMFYMPANWNIQDLFYFSNYTTPTYPNGTYTNASYLGTNASTDLNVTNPVASGLINSFLSNGYTSMNMSQGLVTPDKGNNNVIIVFLVALALFVFVFGIFASRNEMVYLAIPFILLLGVGALPCLSLWNMINSDAGVFVCQVSSAGSSSSCMLSNLFALGTAGILYIMWFLSCLEWWSARSTA